MEILTVIFNSNSFQIENIWSTHFQIRTSLSVCVDVRSGCDFSFRHSSSSLLDNQRYQIFPKKIILVRFPVYSITNIHLLVLLL